MGYHGINPISSIFQQTFDPSTTTELPFKAARFEASTSAVLGVFFNGIGFDRRKGNSWITI